MGNLVRLKTWANKKNIERLYPNAPEIVAKLAKIAAEIAAHSAAPPSNAAVRAAGAQDGFLEDRRIHRTIRGDMVCSKSELAIANILYGFEQQGRLKYFVEQPLPFANKPARWADFMIEARSDQFLRDRLRARPVFKQSDYNAFHDCAPFQKFCERELPGL